MLHALSPHVFGAGTVPLISPGWFFCSATTAGYSKPRRNSTANSTPTPCPICLYRTCTTYFYYNKPMSSSITLHFQDSCLISKKGYIHHVPDDGCPVIIQVLCPRRAVCDRIRHTLWLVPWGLLRRIYGTEMPFIVRGPVSFHGLRRYNVGTMSIRPSTPPISRSCPCHAMPIRARHRHCLAYTTLT